MNYNDGKWHGWNGEDMMPASLHDKSIIEYVWHDERTNETGKTQRQAGWDNTDERPAWSNVIKFRVIKEHRDPREWWVVKEHGKLPVVWGHDPKYHAGIEVIHVREVLE